MVWDSSALRTLDVSAKEPRSEQIGRIGPDGDIRSVPKSGGMAGAEHALSCWLVCVGKQASVTGRRVAVMGLAAGITLACALNRVLSGESATTDMPDKVQDTAGGGYRH